MSNVPQSRKIALVLVPKLSAAASLAGSALILRDITQLYRNKDSYSRLSVEGITPRHRLLAGMSVCDLLSSLAWFLTSWPIPDNDLVTWTIWNVGNQHSCSAQGAFIQWSVGTVMYNGALALYYLLVIRFSVQNRTIAKYWEPWMHFLAVGFPLVTIITGLALGLFNAIGWSCGIQAYPPWCTQSREGKGYTDCLRGDNASHYQKAFVHYPVWIVMAFLIIAMLLIFCKIRAIESTTSRHSVRGPGHLQRRFALGAIGYIGAMFCTWALYSGTFLYFLLTSKRINWWLSFAGAVTLPLQGFLNALIYFRRPVRQSPSSSSLLRRSSRRWRSPLFRFGSKQRQKSTNKVPFDECEIQESHSRDHNYSHHENNNSKSCNDTESHGCSPQQNHSSDEKQSESKD